MLFLLNPNWFTQPSLRADAGAFALTGRDAGLLRARRVMADAGAFALTGQGAIVGRHFTMPAESGVFVVSGKEVAFARALSVAANAGAYTLTGVAAQLVRNLVLAADRGDFVVTGTDTGYILGKALVADMGAFSLSGGDAQFILNRTLSAAAGAFGLTGQNVGLTRAGRMAAAAGAFALGGQAASLERGSNLPAAAGAFAVTGQDATLDLLDPYFSNVALLLHGDGTNGSTTFVDSSSNGLVPTAGGNAQISTAQSKFGGASILFDGSGDFVHLPTTTALSMPGAFTIEMWVYPSVSMVAEKYLFSSINVGSFTIQTVGSNLLTYDTSGHVHGSPPSSGAWHHYALTRNASGVLQGWLDGSLYGSSWTNASTTVYGMSNSDIGSRTSGTAAQSFSGYIDDVRITKGVARYTSAFTPPARAFPDS